MATKAEIQKTLNELGVEFDPKATKAELVKMLPTESDATDFASLYGVVAEGGNGDDAGRSSKCAGLRYAAAHWDGTRKEFIEAAVAYGINHHTAATQWQQGRSAA